MDTLIARFSEQLREAVDIGLSAKVSQPQHEVRNILITGLGGSGIGGNFVQSLVRHKIDIPYVVSKRYDVPSFCNKHTLAVVSSYSGNTEETLQALGQLESQGAHIVCVSSNGQLQKIAREKNYDFIKLPDDWPSPRACLGYSFVQQLAVLYHLGYIEKSWLEQIQTSADRLDAWREDIKQKASHIAQMMYGKTPVIYIEDRLEPVALRFRQQINENSKMLCWHHVIPEMNHNELVGWKDQRDDLAIVFFRDRDEFPRNSVRLDINKEIIANLTNTTIEIFAKGDNVIEKMMYLVHLGDWVTVYLAHMRKMDAVEVDVIDYLKGELKKVPLA